MMFTIYETYFTFVFGIVNILRAPMNYLFLASEDVE